VETELKNKKNLKSTKILKEKGSRILVDKGGEPGRGKLWERAKKLKVIGGVGTRGKGGVFFVKKWGHFGAELRWYTCPRKWGKKGIRQGDRGPEHVENIWVGGKVCCRHWKRKQAQARFGKVGVINLRRINYPSPGEKSKDKKRKGNKGEIKKGRGKRYRKVPFLKVVTVSGKRKVSLGGGV